MIAIITASSPTLAQNYSGPVYSGGSSVDELGRTLPYILSSFYAYGTNPRALITSLGGPIKTQFTWNSGSNNVAAPTQVIVTQTSTVHYGEDYYNSPADGKCDNGFGDPVLNYANGNQHYTCTGTHLSVVAPDANGNIPLSCTPTASCGIGTVCDVEYQAFASVVTLNLTGPLTDGNGKQILDSSGNPQIMVGQGCTASLSGIPSGCTVSYQWSVSDSSSTFQAWSGTTLPIPPAPANANASYYVSGPGPLNNPTAHWYWDDNATTATVTCTATVTPPSGQGSAFPITVTQNVKIVVPTTAESPTIGRVQINSHGPKVYGTNPALYVGGISAIQPYGIIFTTQVQTPAVFVSPSSGSSGLWNLVQKVTPYIWTTLYKYWELPDPGNGITGLDTHYPLYPWTSGSSPFFPSGIAADNLIAQPYDGPGLPNLSNSIGRYRVSESFQTYVMYLPPGSDSQWVPVWLVTWHWNADDRAPIVNGQPDWSTWNDANNAGAVMIDGNMPTRGFPNWNTVVNG